MGASLSNQKVQLTDSITRPDAGSAYRPGDNCSASKKRSAYHFGCRGTAGTRIAKTLPAPIESYIPHVEDTIWREFRR